MEEIDEKMAEKFMKDKKFQNKLMKMLVRETIYCKKCKTELGHVLHNGACMLNNKRVGSKHPSQSTELKGFEISIKPFRNDKKEHNIMVS